MDDLDLDIEPRGGDDAKRSLIVLAVIMVLVLLWSSLNRTGKPPEPTEPPAKPGTATAAAPGSRTPAQLTTGTSVRPATDAPVAPKPATDTPTAPQPPKPASATATVPEPPSDEPEPVEIASGSSVFAATFTNQDGALGRLVLLDYFLTPLDKLAARKARRTDPEADVSRFGFPLLGQDGTDGSLVLLPRTEPAADAPATFFATRRFELVSEDERQVVFRTVFPGTTLEVTKTFRLPAPDDPLQRHALLDVQFRNVGTAPLQVPGYLLQGPGGLAADLTSVSWKSGKKLPNERERTAAAQHLYASVATGSGEEHINAPARSLSSVKSSEKEGEDPFTTEGKDVLWVAVQSNYFAAILEPLRDESEQMSVVRGSARAVNDSNLSAFLDIDGFTLAGTGSAGGKHTVTHRYRLFAGPKMRDALAVYKAHYESVIEGHWYDPLSSIMTWILHAAHAISFNYGIAIIILTIIVRIGLHPLSRKSQTSMARMQKLQPQVKEVRDKYKNDKQRQQQEMMKLYKEYGVNPLGGCLPMLLQLPIFIGLFNALRKSIELRHARFIPWWIEDLAQPDALWGPFNLLPILSVVIMFIQQRMTPKSPDPQQQQTQKIMGYMMPAFLGFIFYNMPSGLNLYFIASMLIGVLEQRHIRHQLDKMGDLKPIKSKSGKPARKAYNAKPSKGSKRKSF